MITLATKEFNGQEHHAFCQREYDEARRFLKTCGKPKDDVDRWLIEQAKISAKIFGGALDRTEAIKIIDMKNSIIKELIVLKQKVISIESCLSVIGNGVAP